MESGDPVVTHLHEIPTTLSEEALSVVLEALWRTRRTGLDTVGKSHLRSLLGFHESRDLVPVLASLRSIIRKSMVETLTKDDIKKIFPLDLATETNDILVKLLQKYYSQWKEEASRDEPMWQRPRVSQQIRVCMPSAPTIPKATEHSSTSWPQEVESTGLLNRSNSFGSILSYPDHLSCMISSVRHPLKGFLSSKEILPHINSMSWSLQNKNSTPSNRVAVITLKLLDHSKVPPEDVEVKFHLSKDTVEAMLRSMTRIHEQLLNHVEQEPLLEIEAIKKKQKQK